MSSNRRSSLPASAIDTAFLNQVDTKPPEDSNSLPLTTLPGPKKRKRVSRVADEGDGTLEEDSVTFSFHDVSPKFDEDRCYFSCSETDLQKWEQLNVRVQEQCVKAVARLFLFKGSRREIIRREHVLDALADLDTSYKKMANAVLRIVQTRLRSATGYAIISAEHIVGVPKSHHGNKATKVVNPEYFLTNGLKDPSLLRILTNGNVNPSYQAFIIVVLLTIYTAPQKKMQIREILSCVRQVDPAFPESLGDSKSSSGPSRKIGAVPDFETDFHGLILQMKREKYIVVDKELTGSGGAADGAGNDFGSQIYTLGPRFFLDIGEKQLLRCYFNVTGLPEDPKLIAKIEEETSRFLR